MQTRVVQKAVILNPHQEVLIIRRSHTDTRRPLQWDLPGGLLESDEELTASIKREIKEETTLEVNALMPLYSKTEVRNWRDNKQNTENVVFIFYGGRSENPTVILSYEHDEYSWLELPQAIKKFEYPIHQEALQYILENKLLSVSLSS